MVKTEILSRRNNSKQLLLVGLIVCMTFFLVNVVSAFDWSDDIVSYWKLDNDDFTDSLSINNGTNTGTINTSGVIIDGRNFDGGDYITIANEENFDYEKIDSFSIQVWIKTTENSTLKQIVAKQANSGSYEGYYIGLYNGTIEIDINSGPVNFLRKTSNDTFNDGNWHHLVMTYDGTNTLSGLKLYVDNITVATKRFRYRSNFNSK